MITGLDVGCEVLKLLRENTGEKVHATGFRKDSLGVTLKAQTTIAKIDKWDYIKTK